MKEKLIIIFAMLALAIAIPYFGTMVLTGTIGTEQETLNNVDTGRTVSLELDGTYTVMDVETYLAGCLPAVLDGEEDPELWKALAVIERTNIYKRWTDRAILMRRISACAIYRQRNCSPAGERSIISPIVRR